MTILHRCLQALAWLLIGLLVLVLTAFAAVKVINWRDDPLSSAAQQALAYTPPTEQELQGNGFLIVAGMDAPQSGDAIANADEWGRQRLANAIERRAWAMAHKGVAKGRPPMVLPMQKTTEPVFSCPADGSDCFTWIEAHKREAQALLEQNQVLLARYAAAANAPYFSNPFRNDLTAPTPPYPWLFRAHALLLAQAALQWQQSQQEQALNTLRQAATLRHRIATSANSLVEPMVALALQYRELRWLSSAIARAGVAGNHQPQLAQLLMSPMPSLQQGLEGEKQSMAREFDALRMGSAFDETRPSSQAKTLWSNGLIATLIDLTFLPNNTLNRMVQTMDELAAISATPLPGLPKAYATYQDRFKTNSCFDLSAVRNYTGKCLSVIAMPNDHTTYVQSIADVEAYRRLVLLQQQALAQHITAANMPAWLAQSPPALRNPYTLEPMQWDAATSSLVFEGKQAQTQNPDQSSTYRVPLRLPVQP